MELKDLLELLYTAHDRFSSLQATFRYRISRPDLMNEAHKRWKAQHPPGSVSELYQVLPWSARLWLWLRHIRSFKQSPPQQESWVGGEFLWRIWLQKPSQWRFEQISEMSHLISIINGDREWSIYKNMKTQQWDVNIPPRQKPASIEHLVNEQPFLDPSFLLSTHILQVEGSTTHAGREAIRVKAIPRKSKETLAPESFWIEADEYELLVDKERGILLRYSAKLDGHEYAVAAAESVVFDEPIPESVFSFTPTPNTKIYVVEG